MRYARSELAFTHLVIAVCIAVLTGSVTAISGGLADYPAAVIRLALLCSSLIFLALLHRPDAIRLNRGAPPLLAFAAVACLSVLASPGITSSLARLELYYSIVVVGFAMRLALPRCLPGTGKLVLLLISLVHAGFLLVALQASMTVASGPESVMPPPYFSNVRHFGYQGYFGASAALAVALTDARLRSTGVMLATAALFGIIMFGSRGALLAWVLFVLVAIALVPDRRAFVRASVLVLVGALALAFVAEKYDWFNTFSLFDRTQAVSGDTVSAFSMRDRVEIWRDSMTAIVQRPLLGFGPEGYLISQCCNPRVAQPHNAILQVLLEFGVFGLAALGWAGVSVFGPRIRDIALRAPRPQRDAASTIALAIAAGYVGFSMIDGLLYFPVPLINFALVCAVVLVRPTRSPASSPGT